MSLAHLGGFLCIADKVRPRWPRWNERKEEKDMRGKTRGLLAMMLGVALAPGVSCRCVAIGRFTSVPSWAVC